MKKSNSRIVIILLTIIMLMTAAINANAASGKWVGTKSAYTRLNNYRKAGKVAALRRNGKLEKTAKVRAKEIAVSGSFSHTRPNGKSSLTLIPGKKCKGENIAMGYDKCSEVSAAWYESPGHRHNMLNKKFKKVGIACYKYKGTKYWVQVFSG